MTHTLSISHKNRKILRAKFARVEKRASVPAARMTANASPRVTNQPVNTVRPDRSQTKRRCNQKNSVGLSIGPRGRPLSVNTRTLPRALRGAGVASACVSWAVANEIHRSLHEFLLFNLKLFEALPLRTRHTGQVGTLAKHARSVAARPSVTPTIRLGFARRRCRTWVRIPLEN